MAAIFRVPNGREPRKLTSMPVKNIFIKGCIKRKYEGNDFRKVVGDHQSKIPILNSLDPAGVV
jgi:hypothetical protein